MDNLIKYNRIMLSCFLLKKKKNCVKFTSSIFFVIVEQ